jgi:hypothetical protein
MVLLPAGARGAWTWAQTDWSCGQYAASDSVDANALTGALILQNDPARLVPAFDSTAWAGAWGLASWRGLLYVAACNYPMHEDYGDIVAYDAVADSLWIDTPVYEEGISVLRTHGDTLFSPGVDNLGAWYWGNIYYNEGAGWIRKETVPAAIHVDDIGFWQDRLWVTTGANPAENYDAILFSSADMGDSWTEEYRLVRIPPVDIRRFYALATYGGSLFVQTDFNAPEGAVVLELTGSEVITHPISAPGGECMGEFAEFQGDLYLLTRSILNRYHGGVWSTLAPPVHSPNWFCRALLAWGGRLYVGGTSGGVAGLCYTVDGVHWQPMSVAPGAALEIEGLAAHQGRLYAASYGDGTVFVTPCALSGTLVSTPHGFPGPFNAGSMTWSAVTTPVLTGIRIQLRSAATEAELPNAPFLGPDGTELTWYETPGSPMSAVHDGDSWLQYRVRLETTQPRLGPMLQEIAIEVDDAATAVPPDATASATGLEIWPNPCRGALNIRFVKTGSVDSGACAAIYNLRGNLVRELVLPPGSASAALRWDGRDRRGARAASGVYLVRVAQGGRSTQAKFVLLH